MSNSKKFAKLFEINGRQVLVTKDTNDDDEDEFYDCPEIRIRVLTDNGHSMTLKLSYEDGKDDARDEVFDAYDENSARNLLESHNEFLRF